MTANMTSLSMLLAQQLQERANAEKAKEDTTCEQCGRTIYKVEDRKYRDGFYRDHVDGRYRHIARPVTS